MTSAVPHPLYPLLAGPPSGIGHCTTRMSSNTRPRSRPQTFAMPIRRRTSGDRFRRHLTSSGDTLPEHTDEITDLHPDIPTRIGPAMQIRNADHPSSRGRRLFVAANGPKVALPDLGNSLLVAHLA